MPAHVRGKPATVVGGMYDFWAGFFLVFFSKICFCGTFSGNHCLALARHLGHCPRHRCGIPMMPLQQCSPFYNCTLRRMLFLPLGLILFC